ncbi:MAG: hypothetical protein C6W57_03470 [Caldibacillus debilis]|nr:hypothetical protein [Bacillaceae bacterium]MBY6271416.1 hypothetical protein [Bacillaceae bacterium]REJ18426.1 MAG: hypothetical protein C6W57_03470 [Caldibacillus debilis]
MIHFLPLSFYLARIFPDVSVALGEQNFSIIFKKRKGIPFFWPFLYTFPAGYDILPYKLIIMRLP